MNEDSDLPHDLLRYAIVKSAECISGRHLLEQTVGAVAKAVRWEGNVGRCENLAQLVVELGRMLEGWTKLNDEEAGKQKLVIVFDGIDRQREAPPTLLPALARLGEIVRSTRNHSTSLLITIPDTQPHNPLHSHRPSPQLSSPPRCPTHPFPLLHQARAPTNPLFHHSQTPTPSRPKRNTRNLVPLHIRSLRLPIQTLRPRHPLLPLHQPPSLAPLHPTHPLQPAILHPIQPTPSSKPLPLPKRLRPNPRPHILF